MINFWHDMWMEKSPLIDKISQEVKTQIDETTTVGYLIDSN